MPERPHNDPPTDSLTTLGEGNRSMVPKESAQEPARAARGAESQAARTLRLLRVGYGWVLNDTVRRARHRSRPSIFAREQNMRPFERRDVRQELRGKR